jgi:hypothetical protein
MAVKILEGDCLYSDDLGSGKIDVRQLIDLKIIHILPLKTQFYLTFGSTLLNPYFFLNSICMSLNTHNDRSLGRKNLTRYVAILKAGDERDISEIMKTLPDKWQNVQVTTRLMNIEQQRGEKGFGGVILSAPDESACESFLSNLPHEHKFSVESLSEYTKPSERL